MNVRVTILGLMSVIALIALGMAAIRTNDEIAAAVFFTLTVSILCTATLIPGNLIGRQWESGLDGRVRRTCEPSCGRSRS